MLKNDKTIKQATRLTKKKKVRKYVLISKHLNVCGNTVA